MKDYDELLVYPLASKQFEPLKSPSVSEGSPSTPPAVSVTPEVRLSAQNNDSKSTQKELKHETYSQPLKGDSKNVESTSEEATKIKEYLDNQLKLLRETFQSAVEQSTASQMGSMESIHAYLEQVVGSQVEAFMRSYSYNQQMGSLQGEILQQIDARQLELGTELLAVRSEQNRIRDPFDQMYQQYQKKERKLLEQQNLQTPNSVRVFYNTIEKVLGAAIVSAMSLASGLIKREDTKTEKGAMLSASVTAGFIEGIPLVGGVVASLMEFGIEEGIGAVKSHSQEKKYNNTLDSLVGFKDAMNVAELVARRLAQSFRGFIEGEKLSEKESKRAGKKAAQAAYDFIKTGQLKNSNSPEEKADCIVKEVHRIADSEAGFFKKQGGVFSKAVKPTPQQSPSQRAWQQNMSNQADHVKKNVEYTQTFSRMNIEKLQREIEELKAKIPKADSDNSQAGLWTLWIRISEDCDPVEVEFHPSHRVNELKKHIFKHEAFKGLFSSMFSFKLFKDGTPLVVTKRIDEVLDNNDCIDIRTVTLE